MTLHRHIDGGQDLLKQACNNLLLCFLSLSFCMSTWKLGNSRFASFMPSLPLNVFPFPCSRLVFYRKRSGTKLPVPELLLRVVCSSASMKYIVVVGCCDFVNTLFAMKNVTCLRLLCLVYFCCLLDFSCRLNIVHNS